MEIITPQEMGKKKINETIELFESTYEIVQPQPNEEKLLAYILGDNFKELQTTAANAVGKQLENFVKGSLNMTILPVNNVKAINDWLGAAILTTTAIYELGLGIHNYLKIEEKKRIREERFKNQANKLRKELIEMMIDENLDEVKEDKQNLIEMTKYSSSKVDNINENRKELEIQNEKQTRKEMNFRRATQVYLARYYATYFIDEISYGNKTMENKKDGKTTDTNIRLYTSIENYKEYFTSQGKLSEKIDKHRSKLVELKIDNIIPDPKYSCFGSRDYSDYVEYIVNKNYLDFVKQENQEEFALKYKLYRAYMKQGEFDKQSCFGDRNEVKRALLCTLFVGFGIIPGILYSVSRITSEIKWKKNKPRLREIMRTYLKVETRINDIIGKKYAIEKLKYYNDLTKSKYGIYLLEKNLEELSYEFKNKECEKSFDIAFDLFQKMSYTGIADRFNYVHFNIEYKK
ncbi:uncharacterized protein LOC100210320 [Hydra vulgaris]|uniref:uncharacterized protein LOC100210320 n=1 Tax=Hydra vulgaris TaxID=6087 RepID=UPI00019240CA|nr:uncharacterized protein LOC100210320 [Hydra vulgaris]